MAVVSASKGLWGGLAVLFEASGEVVGHPAVKNGVVLISEYAKEEGIDAVDEHGKKIEKREVTS